MKANEETHNIVSLFFRQASRRPESIAIIEKDTAISYSELALKVETYAAFLRSKTLQRGDRVLIFLPVSIELYVVVLAVMQIGCVAVFLDPWSDKKRLKASAKLADCKALVAGTKLRWLSRVLPVFRNIPLKLSPTAKEGEGLKDIENVKAQDTALITFTTGSSGTPKGANRTHEFLRNQLRALQKEIEPLQEDVCLTNLPVFTLSHLAKGITSVIADYNPRKPGKMKAGNILKQLQQHAVKTLVVSPDFLLRLTDDTIQGDPALQRIFTGGAPVFPDQAQKISQAFPEIKTVVAYGSTEAEPISSIPLQALLEDQELNNGGLPVGKLHPDCELKIISWRDEDLQPSAEELEKLEMPEGQIGEIVVSGPHVLKEYYKSPTAQKRQKFEINGKLWHRTGDSGFLQNECLYLTGPCKQLIEYGQTYIAPFLVEYRLRKLPSIEEGTLVSHQGKKSLYLVKAARANKHTARMEIDSTGIPYDEVRFIKALPKDPRHNSKIDYSRLI